MLLLACCLALPLSGCTEEKANALQVAAKQFRNESLSALDLYESFTISTIRGTRENQDETVAFLVGKLKEHGKKVDLPIFNALLNYGHESDAAVEPLKEEFSELKKYYTLFASIFDSVQRGHYFNKEAVARAEHVSIKLTLQLIQYAETLKEHSGYMFTADRARALDRLNKALESNNDADLRSAVEDILSIRNREDTAKAAVITQLLKAAEAGRIVTESIKDYGNLTANDILNNITDGLNVFAGLNIAGVDTDGLIAKYADYAQSVRSDPYWGPVLDMPIN
ncbi:hypothetical protein [Pseudodesulfovibrio hydrargyri]|nr:hypothetical protein [Pseudodesulfovibrio hydrargyri]